MTKFEVSDAMVEAASKAQTMTNIFSPVRRDAVRRKALRAAISAAIEASGLDDLITILDAVLDHADAHCRAFPIATAPRDGRKIEIWDSMLETWDVVALHSQTNVDADFTHWRERLPPPSNPPLPAVFTELGAALEKLKANG
jgi:hypothetical protein